MHDVFLGIKNPIVSRIAITSIEFECRGTSYIGLGTLICILPFSVDPPRDAEYIAIAAIHSDDIRP